MGMYLVISFLALPLTVAYSILSRRKESRRRNLQFHLPLMIPLAPHIRIVEDDESYISLQGIYEDHCRRVGMSKDEPLIFAMHKATPDSTKPGQPDPKNMRLEIFNAIQYDMVPNSVALEVHFTLPGFITFPILSFAYSS